MKAYSNDLRKRIVDARANGDTAAEVAERFSVGIRFIFSLMKRVRDTGSYEAKKNSGGSTPLGWGVQKGAKYKDTYGSRR